MKNVVLIYFILGEKKEQKFKRIAENRVNKIIKLIRLLGNLSNKRNYKYDSKEIDKIFYALQQELKSTKQRFTTESDKEDKPFKL
ncbi:hypothetical protein SAMN04487764_1939 [Gillisia sp. Hel1_33_143]|uniref:hypothetical protein n=1 Tax=Gillisia sp. Hel1_33_143 TaxID=1336796 RepID=UPI00087D4BC1|nr:hypothetical protein [Gillisia sp. Hel1_33_143]SDS31489.1 hypothetical protein SAMN04487764_1939 [Gillisia sp. Hel1_33_143]